MVTTRAQDKAKKAAKTPLPPSPRGTRSRAKEAAGVQVLPPPSSPVSRPRGGGRGKQNPPKVLTVKKIGRDKATTAKRKGDATGNTTPSAGRTRFVYRSPSQNLRRARVEDQRPPKRNPPRLLSIQQIEDYVFSPRHFSDQLIPTSFPTETSVWPPQNPLDIMRALGEEVDDCAGETCYTDELCFSPDCEHSFDKWRQSSSASWKTHFELRQTQDRGIGVFTKTAFKKDTVLGWYTGQIVPFNNADSSNSQYLMDFAIGGSESSGTDGSPNMVWVDSATRGNWTRFMNHSCSAHCCFYPMRVGRTRIMAVLANRKIPAGVELTVDYGADYWETRGWDCLCNAPKCMSKAKKNAPTGSSGAKKKARETTQTNKKEGKATSNVLGESKVGKKNKRQAKKKKNLERRMSILDYFLGRTRELAYCTNKNTILYLPYYTNDTMYIRSIREGFGSLYTSTPLLQAPSLSLPYYLRMDIFKIFRELPHAITPSVYSKSPTKHAQNINPHNTTCQPTLPSPQKEHTKEAWPHLPTMSTIPNLSADIDIVQDASNEDETSDEHRLITQETTFATTKSKDPLPPHLNSTLSNTTATTLHYEQEPYALRSSSSPCSPSPSSFKQVLGASCVYDGGEEEVGGDGGGCVRDAEDKERGRTRVRQNQPSPRRHRQEGSGRVRGGRRTLLRRSNSSSSSMLVQ
ncbi:unnamed protein product [Periconia digitata]|uniref:SET domain-containing protein n=1 Tax=Periconia digitata TaxID=1303443 RepID=A0A9W4XQR4_9PLEO|nr:unnamed protein product [Periconia digitata]